MQNVRLKLDKKLLKKKTGPNLKNFLKKYISVLHGIIKKDDIYLKNNTHTHTHTVV